MTLSEEYLLEENMMDSWEVVHMELFIWPRGEEPMDRLWL